MIVFLKAMVTGYRDKNGRIVPGYHRRDRVQQHHATRALTADTLVPVVEVPQMQFSDGQLATARRAMLEHARTVGWLGQPLRNEHSGMDIVVTRRTLDHTYANHGRQHVLLVPAIPALVRSAVLTHREAHDPPTAEVAAVATLWGAARIAGADYRVKLKVKERKSPLNAGLYDLLAVELGVPVGSGSSRHASEAVDGAPAPDTAIKLGDLLRGVKGAHAKYVPSHLRGQP